MAHRMNPATTLISEVMTPHPTLVRMDDSAMDCLGIMIERHFRHLPVVDGNGNIAGLLSIAKCLYDAIHRLEKKAMRAAEKGNAGGNGVDLAAIRKVLLAYLGFSLHTGSSRVIISVAYASYTTAVCCERISFHCSPTAGDRGTSTVSRRLLLQTVK